MGEAYKDYQASKTVKKTVEPGIAVGIITLGLKKLVSVIGINADNDALIGAATIFYGFYRGVLNYIKHR